MNEEGITIKWLDVPDKSQLEELRPFVDHIESLFEEAIPGEFVVMGKRGDGSIITWLANENNYSERLVKSGVIIYKKIDLEEFANIKATFLTLVN